MSRLGAKPFPALSTLIAVLAVLLVASPSAAVAPASPQVLQQDTSDESDEGSGNGGDSSDGDHDDESAEQADAATGEAPAAVVAKRGDRGSTVRSLQAALNQAGFSAGPADGIFGRLTQSAVRAFQSAVALEATGVYDTTTAQALETYTPPQRPDPPPTTMSIRDAQRLLAAAGFDPGPIDGLDGPKTRAGLRAFQQRAGIPATGRIDATTAEALTNWSGGTGDPDPENPDPDPDNPDPDEPDGNSSLRQAQQALKDGPFDPGPVDGVYGTKTKNAIWALEKLTGIPMDGQWSGADEAALQRLLRGEVGGPSVSHGRRWVEVDLSQQLMKVYDPGNPVPVLVSHVSSGSGIPWRQGRYSGRSITPVGSFTIFRRISGWRQSSLGIGGLYNPLYFTNSGIALHGSRSVPAHPASHGCVRVPMHIAEYLPSMLPNGTPVEVTR